MGRWKIPFVYALLAGLLSIGAIILIRILRVGWSQLTEVDFWIEKAIGFGVMVIILTLFYHKISRPQS